MPEPLEDLNRDHQCHFYQAPTGQRCGSPALKGEYYCYHHHLKHYKRANRVLIDPEVTRMELPVIEDRASIFVALTAVIHRLAENTIDTRRAGQMIYGLQLALRALEPPRTPRTPHVPSSPNPTAENPSANGSSPSPTSVSNAPATAKLEPANQQPPTPPKTIPITKEGLVYFLRSRHCAHCNAELFPPEELTERRNPGAPPDIIPEAHQALDGYECLILGPPPALSDEIPPKTPPLTVEAEPETLHPEAANPTMQAQAASDLIAPTHHTVPAEIVHGESHQTPIPSQPPTWNLAPTP